MSRAVLMSEQTLRGLRRMVETAKLARMAEVLGRHPDVQTAMDWVEAELRRRHMDPPAEPPPAAPTSGDNARGLFGAAHPTQRGRRAVRR